MISSAESLLVFRVGKNQFLRMRAGADQDRRLVRQQRQKFVIVDEPKSTADRGDFNDFWNGRGQSSRGKFRVRTSALAGSGWVRTSS